METCRHCGRAVPQLQGMLILLSNGAAWYTHCCVWCKAAYQQQNALERKRRMRQRHYTGDKGASVETSHDREVEKLRETLRAIRAINDRIIAGIGTSMPATVAALKTANSLIDQAESKSE